MVNLAEVKVGPVRCTYWNFVKQSLTTFDPPQTAVC